MSHRFTTKSQTSYIKYNHFFSYFFSRYFFCFLDGTHIHTEKRWTKKASRTLQTAVTRSVTCCYEEGSYPESLDYLKEHYGLHYDESKYFVDYQPIGSNIMPDITIMRKGGN